MSFQIVYHAVISPLSSGAEGCVCARSRTLPDSLQEMTESLSRKLCPGALVGPGRRFCYSTLLCESVNYHVLSSLTLSAAEGSHTYIAHHLILTPEEEQKLRRNASRPTPAGIILALCDIGVWCTENAHQRFPYIDNEPRLTAAALPDSVHQLTWEKLSGNKDNARSFFTPPYDRECVVIVPEHTTEREILRLLHESDCLSASRGWNKPFCTYPIPDISPQPYLRIFTSSVPAAESVLSSMPKLVISEKLQLLEHPHGSQQSENSNERIARAATGAESSTRRTSYLPYKYTETPDVDVFKVTARPHKWIRWSCYLAGVWLLWSSTSLIATFMMDDAGELTGNIITQVSTGEDLLLLSQLAASAYSPESTSRHLEKFEARLRSLPPTGENKDRDLLLECVRLLRGASIEQTNHPAQLIRLRDCAASLHLRTDDMCRLYLNEYIHGINTGDLAPSYSPEEIEQWKSLEHSAPALYRLLCTPPADACFRAAGIITTPPASETEAEPPSTTRNAQQ